jgi:hypothetical protein
MPRAPDSLASSSPSSPGSGFSRLGLLGRCNSSARRAAFLAKEGDIPIRFAISFNEKPQEIGVAICRKVA